jgi:hypothetical protein
MGEAAVSARRETFILISDLVTRILYHFPRNLD